MKRKPPKPKTPKSPKNPAKRKPALPRSEWDFAKVPRAAAAAVCMREYAKEILRVWGALLPIMEDMEQDLLKLCPQLAPRGALIARVRDGLRKRRALPDRDLSPPHGLIALNPAQLLMDAITGRSPSAKLPRGSQLALFAIDWRAGNNAIKRDFAKWIDAKHRAPRPGDDWIDGENGVISQILGYDGGLPTDYSDAMRSLFDVWPDERAHDGGYAPGGKEYIEALRRVHGEKKGRGDSKPALLTDLAVYRLHRTGCTGRGIAKKLGANRLKFYDSALINRAIRSAKDHMKDTLISAFVCEGFAIAGGLAPAVNLCSAKLKSEPHIRH